MVVMERPTALKASAERGNHGGQQFGPSIYSGSWGLRAGLIIISAHYGLASVFTDRGRREHEGEEEVMIDVTVPVQALVNDSRLYIPGGRGKVNLSRHRHLGLC